ncbi:MAG: ABC transporter ATP-binding protein [Acidimicrobiales bacterium]
MSAAVEVDELTIRYGDAVAVDGISFKASLGEITALLGPNGAGKTSTIETLEGYRKPDVGSVRVLGLDPVHDRAALVSLIGVMLQSGGVYPAMSAAQMVRLFAAFYDEAEDPAALIDAVGLGSVATTPWRRLSGGEQQRLSLALALVGRPEVAFLDEPTAGVDPRGRQALRDVVIGLRDRGAAVVLTTHDLDEADRLADRVVILDHGRVVAAGTPASVRAADGVDEIRFATAPEIDLAGLEAAIGAPVAETQAGEYVAAVAPAPATIARLTAWLAEHDLPLGDLRAGRQTLEDVFLRLTAEPSSAAPDAAPARRSRRARRGTR